jgi:hypothetical protein
MTDLCWSCHQQCTPQATSRAATCIRRYFTCNTCDVEWQDTQDIPPPHDDDTASAPCTPAA